ncbi:MAG: hypothetical protein JNM93_12870 [Bacteriovoracaceae bacterium]|nr:hypothetical protein [Bacteriovoracaceae bacterium]
MSFLNLINSFIPKSRQKYYTIKTFTYFIPAPPNRKKGYQEKEFDKLTYELVKHGHEIISISTQAIASSTTAGMWVLCTLGATTKKAAELDLDFCEKFGLESASEDSSVVIEL